MKTIQQQRSGRWNGDTHNNRNDNRRLYWSLCNVLMHCRRQSRRKQVLVGSAQFQLRKIGGCGDYIRERKTV